MPRGIPHTEFLSWSDDDQDKALTFLKYESSRCTTCGTRHQDWERDSFAYIGDTYRCPGCEILEQEQGQIPPDQKGIHVRLRKRTE